MPDGQGDRREKYVYAERRTDLRPPVYVYCIYVYRRYVYRCVPPVLSYTWVGGTYKNEDNSKQWHMRPRVTTTVGT